MDDLLHAWAVFGLKPGSSVESVRKRYRALAKQWHPDRYTQDPQGQAEASIQMRVLNMAYERLLTAAVASEMAHKPGATTTGVSATAVPQRGRLSREELDHMIQSLGTRSPVDDLIDELPYGHRYKWYSERSPAQIKQSVAAGLAFLVGCLGMLVLEWRGGDALNSKWWLAVFAAPVIVGVASEARRRS